MSQQTKPGQPKDVITGVNPHLKTKWAQFGTLVSVFFFWGFVAASNDILIPVSSFQHWELYYFILQQIPVHLH